MKRFIYRCSGKIASFFFPWRKAVRQSNAVWYQLRSMRNSINELQLNVEHLEAKKANRRGRMATSKSRKK